MKAVDVRPRARRLRLPHDPRIIDPGKPFSSALYFRMAKFGRDRMPHIGSDMPDEAGLQLIHDWIAGMKRESGRDRMWFNPTRCC